MTMSTLSVPERAAYPVGGDRSFVQSALLLERASRFLLANPRCKCGARSTQIGTNRAGQRVASCKSCREFAEIQARIAYRSRLARIKATLGIR